MKMKVLHIIIALWAIGLVCVSCSQEDITRPVSAGDGQVKIVYKVAGTSMSRATEQEAGWGDEDGDGTDEWHENIINRIDLFIFNCNDETLFKHIALSENLNIDAESEQTFAQNELTYNDVITDDYIYYMVANCEFENNDIVEGTFTLDDLKKKTTLALTFNTTQTSFAMDGKIEDNPDPVDNVVTLNFELNRAAAKIRLSVVDKDGQSIMEQCQFRLHNYILNGTSVLAEAESNIYGNGDWQTRVSESTNLAWNDVLKKDNQAVFYSYPNDWFDESLLNSDGTFIEDDTYAKYDLIDETRQTYIRLTAPFTGEDGQERMYYYKVPVNYSIADNNDQVSFTKEQIETLRNDYYRMQRNHIYYVKVKVDRKGGITEDDEVILQNMNYLVADWGEENITIPEFE